MQNEVLLHALLTSFLYQEMKFYALLRSLRFRKFSFKIDRFSFSMSRLGWEVFHWSDCLVFLPHLPFRLGGFLLNQPNQVFYLNFWHHCQLSHQLLVSLFSFSMLGDFLPAAYSLIFWFSPSVLTGLKCFSLNNLVSSWLFLWG